MVEKIYLIQKRIKENKVRKEGVICARRKVEISYNLTSMSAARIFFLSAFISISLK